MAVLSRLLLAGTLACGAALAKPAVPSTLVPRISTTTTTIERVEVRQATSPTSTAPIEVRQASSTEPLGGCIPVVEPADVSCFDPQTTSGSYSCTTKAFTTVTQCWNAAFSGPAYMGVVGPDIDVTSVQGQDPVYTTFTATYGATVVLAPEQTADLLAPASTDWVFQVTQDVKEQIYEKANEACDSAGLFMPGKRQSQVATLGMFCAVDDLPDWTRLDLQKEVAQIIKESQVAIPMPALLKYAQRPGPASMPMKIVIGATLVAGVMKDLSEYGYIGSEMKVPYDYVNRAMSSSITQTTEWPTMEVVPPPKKKSKTTTTTESSACPIDATVNPEDEQGQDGPTPTDLTNIGSPAVTIPIMTPPPLESRTCSFYNRSMTGPMECFGCSCSNAQGTNGLFVRSPLTYASSGPTGWATITDNCLGYTTFPDARIQTQQCAPVTASLTMTPPANSARICIPEPAFTNKNCNFCYCTSTSRGTPTSGTYSFDWTTYLALPQSTITSEPCLYSSWPTEAASATCLPDSVMSELQSLGSAFTSAKQAETTGFAFPSPFCEYASGSLQQAGPSPTPYCACPGDVPYVTSPATFTATDHGETATTTYSECGYTALPPAESQIGLGSVLSVSTSSTLPPMQTSSIICPTPHAPAASQAFGWDKNYLQNWNGVACGKLIAKKIKLGKDAKQFAGFRPTDPYLHGWSPTAWDESGALFYVQYDARACPPDQDSIDFSTYTWDTCLALFQNIYKPPTDSNYHSCPDVIINPSKQQPQNGAGPPGTYWVGGSYYSKCMWIYVGGRMDWNYYNADIFVA